MNGINYVALIVIGLVAFVMSTCYYIIFGKTRNRLLGIKEQADFRPAPTKVLAEIVRTLVVAFVFATILSWTGDETAGGGLKLAVLAWIGFPAVLLWGSVMWDKVPAKLAAIHAGDWLLKLVLMGLVLGAWHR